MALPMTHRSTGARLRPTSDGTSSTTTTTTASTPRTTTAAGTRPTMTVVAGRRRYAWIAVVATVLMMLLMVGSVLLHTAAAERQLQIDELERGVREYAGAFDTLRAERAELRSPVRLADAAIQLGMAPTVESEYVDVDPMAYARLIAQSGFVPDGAAASELGLAVDMDPLQQYELVKAAGAELP